jgi:hypothetical protein
MRLSRRWELNTTSAIQYTPDWRCSVRGREERGREEIGRAEGGALGCVLRSRMRSFQLREGWREEEGREEERRGAGAAARGRMGERGAVYVGSGAVEVWAGMA